MRHVSLVLQDRSVIGELLDDDLDAIRNQFWVLSYPECISHLAASGAATFNFRTHSFRAPAPSSLPFVPGLGALRINAKAQLEHRALRHYRGFSQYAAPSLPSSAIGVQLAHSVANTVSEFRLGDTYLSAENESLTRRRASEGDIDYFISDDESTWHVALSIEPRRRISIEPLTGVGRALLEQAGVFPRIYAHVYPHGGLTVMLNLSLVFKDDTDAQSVVKAVKILLGKRAEPAFQFDMAGIACGSATDVVQAVRTLTTRAIVPEAQIFESIHLDYAVSVGADQDEVSDAALSGLLTLDERYETFKQGWLEARASLYGRYDGDRVVASRTSLAVATSPRLFSPSGRRRFFWRCLGIKEFVALQQLVITRATMRLSKLGTLGGPAEDTARRLIAICEHLIEFPRGLPAHHRKWLYECQRVSRVERTLDYFFRTMAELQHEARRVAMMRTMSELAGVHINVTDSQIGTLNLGMIIGDVENHLASVTGPEADDVRLALHQIAEAVVAEPALSDTDREVLLQNVDLLAEEASKEPAKRRTAVAKTVLATLAAALSAAGSLATVWTTVGPTLSHFFGA